MTNKRVLSAFTFNCLQTGYWIRVDYYIVMNWTYVSVIVQCQSDGCSLSSKDGAVVWQSFGQLAAGCLTILEMAVDDRRCPDSLVHFGAISVNFIMWSLCFTVLIEFSLGFFSGDHSFAHTFNKVVSLGIVIMRSRWKAGCPQGADQLSTDLCRGHGCLYLEANGRGRRLGHVSSPIWPGRMQISSGFGQIHARHDMLGCQRRHEFSDSNAWIASTDVSPKKFHWPRVYRLEIGLVQNAHLNIGFKPNGKISKEYLWYICANRIPKYAFSEKLGRV